MNSAHPPSRSETRWGLQPKLILSMLLVGVVPLMVGLGLAFWQGSREIQVVNGESFKAIAEETASAAASRAAKATSNINPLMRESTVPSFCATWRICSAREFGMASCN